MLRPGLTLKFFVLVGSVFLAGVSLANDETKKNFPLHIAATVNNSVGIGTFVNGYQRTPSWSTELELRPSYDFPKVKWLPAISASAKMGMYLGWLQSYQTSGQVREREIRVTDLEAWLGAPSLVEFGNTGLALSFNLGAKAPTSKSSQAYNRAFGYNVSSGIAWTHKEFTASYAPGFSGWLHSGTMRTIDCGDVASLNDPNLGLEDRMQALVANRSEEVVGGKCIISGRQILGTVTNMLGITWSPGRHSIAANLGWYVSFLRPLSRANPELSSKYASGQGFSELSYGALAYTYNVPVDFDLSASTGVMTYQGAYNSRGNLRFPFFDFATPSKNLTQLFFSTTVGI